MQIKYLSLNIWNGGMLFDNVIEFLKREHPDILSLQEVYNNHGSEFERRYRTIDVLQDIFHYPYTAFAPAFRKHENNIAVEQGNAVFSKFPITATQITFYDKPYRDIYGEQPEDYPFYPRNLQYAALDAHGKTINVFNTHGIWGEDGNDNPRRLHMSDVMIKQVKNKERVILSGDTNTSHYTKTITNIEKHLTNVFKDELKSSFNMKQKDKPGYATSVVDVLFVSPDIRIIEHSMPDVNVSDHMPLIAVLEI